METPHKFATLDGLRGLAAIAVMALHLNFTPGVSQGLSSAYLAVDLFFILSGFVIAHAYSGRLDTTMTAGRFIVLRMIRLYPLYFAGLTLGALWRVGELVIQQPDAMTPLAIGQAFVLGLAFLPAPSGGATSDAWPLNPVFWSLFFEMIVNIGAALWWRHLSNRVLALIVAIGAAVLVFAAATMGSLQHGYEFADLWVGLARAVFSFFAGIAVFRSGRYLGRISLPAFASILIVTVVLLMPVSGQARPIYDLAAILFIFPAIVVIARQNPGPLLTSIFVTLGAASYAIYTLHRPLVGFVGKAGEALNAPLAVSATAFMVFMTTAAIVIDRVYDGPARKRLAVAVKTTGLSQRASPS